MSKLRNFLPNMLGGTAKEHKKKERCTHRLESDALPVDDGADRNNEGNRTSNNNAIETPTASAELTASVVRELSNPDYNSLDMQVTNVNDTNNNINGALTRMSPTQIANPLTMQREEDANASGATTLNTMNVHNAQQQLVMQFSNINKLHFGSVYNFNSNVVATTPACASRKSSTAEDSISVTSGTSSDSSCRRPRKTTSIFKMMQSQEEPNHRLLDTLATHLGEGWKQVMRDLGHSEGQIEQAIIDHQIHGGIKEVIYQLLLDWVRNANDGEATLGRLTTLLWETNHRDCVERMKLVWKALQHLQLQQQQQQAKKTSQS